MKVTIEGVHFAYDIAKRHCAGQIPFAYAAEMISKQTGMPVASAKYYINNLKHMLEGHCYMRTLNAYATEYYIEHIRTDYGEQAYRSAIEATQKHVAYYNGLGYGKRRCIEKLLKDLK